MSEALLMKVPNGFVADEAANEPGVFDGIRTGETIRVKWTRPRQLHRHRRFFAMLNFAFDHWEPVDKQSGKTPGAKIILSFLNYCEKKAPAKFINYLKPLVEGYLKSHGDWMNKREPAKSVENFRKEAIIMAGYYEAIFSLDGSMKLEAKSMSFSKMGEDEFQKLYNAVANVLIKQVLTNYTKDDLDQVVDQLVRM